MLPPQFDASMPKRGMGESRAVGIVEDRCGFREPPAWRTGGSLQFLNPMSLQPAHLPP